MKAWKVLIRKRRIEDGEEKEEEGERKNAKMCSIGKNVESPRSVANLKNKREI